MLNNHQDGISTDDILSKLKASTSEEPSVDDTPKEDEVSLQDDNVDEATETEEESITESADSEDDESLAEVESEDDDEEPVYLIGDREITLSRIKELEDGNLRQSDYTKKTTEASETRKKLESRISEVDSQYENLSSKIESLEGIINAENDEVDWDELADDDPSEYLRKKRSVDKKQKALNDAKAIRDDLTAKKANDEAQLLNSKMPEWAKEGGQEARQKDVDNALKVASRLGFSDQDLSKNVDHRFYLALIELGRVEGKQKKAEVAKKKLAKAPRVTPTNKAATKKLTKSQETLENLRKTGSEKDAIAAIRSRLS